LSAAGTEELDEFNEAPHVVHGDSGALADAGDDEEVLFARPAPVAS
jgi:hypothetical protein